MEDLHNKNREMVLINHAESQTAEAEAEAWNYAFGYIKSSVLVCAVELDIPDILENHGAPMSLSELSAAADCPPAPLFRLMRFLIFHGVFQKTDDPPTVHYAPTPLSRYLTRAKLGAFMRLQGSPLGRSPVALTAESLRSGTPFYLKSIDGEDSWTDPTYGFHTSVFTDAMTAHARLTTAAIVANYPEAFHGVGSVVDVGGRHGMALGELVKAFPWVRGITFDLPEIVAEAPPRQGVDFVGGNMFELVPNADAVMLMWILHDWSDKACIEILKKCKEAIPAEGGKVVILEAIIDEDGGEGDEFAGPRLCLDMIMMAVTAQGKERTHKEWAHLLTEAGFSRHTVKNIKAFEFVIEAYP